MTTNTEIAKSCYAAFLRGDMGAIMAALTDDIVWITPGTDVPTTGARRGKAEVARFFEQVSATWNFTAFDPQEYVESGDTVVAIGTYAGTARATGASFEANWTMVWKFRDGKVAYFREYTDTEAMAGAATKRSAA